MRFRRFLAGGLVAAAACGGDATSPAAVPPCDADNGGITLPAGFCATVFADNLVRPRHMALSASGDLYIAQSGGQIIALRDTNHDGHSDMSAAFGPQVSSGLSISGDFLYVHYLNTILRYTLAAGQLLPSDTGSQLLFNLPTGGHATRSLAATATSIYVNVGSTGNVCTSVTTDPCEELETRGGIWRFSATTLQQTFSTSARYATGIRNAMGLAIHPVTGGLWATQHGRDNLHTNFPTTFAPPEGIENPAEELFDVQEGADFGWPYCYFDTRAGKRVLAPEYGGNRSTEGRCAATKAPAAVFPAHWAPNGIVFYDGTLFPSGYRRGAFIAFHGSYNRSPAEQAGFLVAFVPASGPGLSATYQIFADGFKGTGSLLDANAAAHRPTGLAVDASGALYIGDDLHGRIWRVVYRGQ